MFKIYNVTLNASSAIRGIETIHVLNKRNRTLICSQFQSLVRHKTQLCREINVPYRIDTKKNHSVFRKGIPLIITPQIKSRICGS